METIYSKSQTYNRISQQNVMNSTQKEKQCQFFQNMNVNSSTKSDKQIHYAQIVPQEKSLFLRNSIIDKKLKNFKKSMTQSKNKQQSYEIQEKILIQQNKISENNMKTQGNAVKQQAKQNKTNRNTNLKHKQSIIDKVKSLYSSTQNLQRDVYKYNFLEINKKQQNTPPKSLQNNEISQEVIQNSNKSAQSDSQNFYHFQLKQSKPLYQHLFKISAVQYQSRYDNDCRNQNDFSESIVVGTFQPSLKAVIKNGLQYSSQFIKNQTIPNNQNKKPNQGRIGSIVKQKAKKYVLSSNQQEVRKTGSLKKYSQQNKFQTNQYDKEQKEYDNRFQIKKNIPRINQNYFGGLNINQIDRNDLQNKLQTTKNTLDSATMTIKNTFDSTTQKVYTPKNQNRFAPFFKSKNLMDSTYTQKHQQRNVLVRQYENDYFKFIKNQLIKLTQQNTQYAVKQKQHQSQFNKQRQENKRLYKQYKVLKHQKSKKTKHQQFQIQRLQSQIQKYKDYLNFYKQNELNIHISIAQKIKRQQDLYFKQQSQLQQLKLQKISKLKMLNQQIIRCKQLKFSNKFSLNSNIKLSDQNSKISSCKQNIKQRLGANSPKANKFQKIQQISIKMLREQNKRLKQTLNYEQKQYQKRFKKYMSTNPKVQKLKVQKQKELNLLLQFISYIKKDQTLC